MSPVRVIDQHQTQLGVLPTFEALGLARDAGLDLVEVSPMESPPVCRIMDYGKHKYEKKKRQKQGSAGHVITLKEIRLRPKTDTHDRAIKMKRVNEFLHEGHKVQFTMLFRGRERFHKERGLAIFEEILAELGEAIKVERRPVSEGRRMTMMVAPVRPGKSMGGPKASKTPSKAPPKAKPESAPPVVASAPKEHAPPEVVAAPPASPAPEAGTSSARETPSAE